MDKKIVHKLAKNFSSLIIAQIVYKVLTFVTTILIARFLGAEGFGQFSYGLSFVWAFLFLSDFGLNELFIRDVALDNKLLSKYVNNVISIKIFVGAIAYMMLVFLAYLFSFSMLKFWIILILGAAIILDSFTYFFRCLFRVRETMEYEAGLMIVEAFLKIAILFLAIKSGIGFSDVILVSFAVLAISAINFVINLIIFIFNHKKIHLSLDLNLSFYLLRNGLPLAVIYVLSLINFRIDIIMLSLMRSDTMAGWFNADYKLLEQFLLVPIIFSYVSLPLFSKSSDSLNKLKILFRNILPFLFLLGILALILFYTFADLAIRLIYGEVFQDACVYLQMLSWVLLPLFLKPVLEKLLFSLRKQAVICLVYLTGMALNIILNMIMIPKMGINGASLGTVLSESLIVFVCIIITYRNLFIIPVVPKKVLDIDKSTVPEELIY